MREALGGNRTEAGTIPPPSRCQVVRWEGGVTVDVYNRLLLEQMGEGKTIEEATAYLQVL